MEMPHIHEITKRDLEEINSLFTKYLFYKTLPDGNRQFECTHCNAEFTAGLNKRTVTDSDNELMRARHNEVARCPKCGSVGTVKSIGKAKECKNLYEEQRIVVFYRINENYVQAIARIAIKEYNACLHRPQIYFSKINQSNYYFRPGKVTQYHKDYYDFHICNVASEPFRKKTSMFYGFCPDNSYSIIGLERLEKSYLRYHLLNAFENIYVQMHRERWNYYSIEIPEMRYLCRFSEYPQIELLQKMGFNKPVLDLVEAGIKNFPIVNWKAKDLCGFFKLNKYDFKLFKEAGGDFELLRMNRELQKLGIAKDFSGMLKLCNLMPNSGKYYYFNRLLENPDVPFLDKLKYVDKQSKKINQSKSSIIGTLYDYWRMAKDVGYDLTVPTVRFPKNIEAAHDTVNEVHIKWLEEKEAKEQAEREVRARPKMKEYMKQYCFNNGDFFIKVPTTTKEIINEGKEQSHCVGGYAARHLEGKLAILFLRSKAEPDKALYTIEMHDKKLTQVQGYHNEIPLTPKAKDFLDMWLKWVMNGSKRKKDGTPKLLLSKKGA